MKKPIKKFLVTIEQGIQLMRKSKDHMEVRGIDHFGSALINPDLFQDCLAVGTVPVTAGIIMYFCMPAFRAPGEISPKGTGLAVQDSERSFFLNIRLVMLPLAVIGIRKFPDLLDLKIIHAHILLKNQKDFSPDGEKPGQGGHRSKWNLKIYDLKGF